MKVANEGENELTSGGICWQALRWCALFMACMSRTILESDAKINEES